MKLSAKGNDLDRYAKSALIMIVRLRYLAFVEKFGREPGQHDPLFFDESESSPVKADPETARQQIIEGAKVAGVKSAPVLKFLGLDCPPAEQERPWSLATRQPVHQSGNLARRKPVNQSPVWSKFLADRDLHRRHGITNEELKLVSGASFLGEASGVDDILFVLNVIRDSQRTS